MGWQLCELLCRCQCGKCMDGSMGWWSSVQSQPSTDRAPNSPPHPPTTPPPPPPTHAPEAAAPLLRRLHAHVEGRLEPVIRALRPARLLRDNRRQLPDPTLRLAPLVAYRHLPRLAAPLVLRGHRQGPLRVRWRQVGSADGGGRVVHGLARPQRAYLDLSGV
jgi:hypothetical protein